MNVKLRQHLDRIDAVLANGKYKDTWQSLAEYPVPEWYAKAKFGIFIHWGVYSVPAFGNEWYPHNMYLKGSSEYEHHLVHYGDHKSFGYKDFIPLFRGEHFSAQRWVELFRRAGAKYIMPVAEHHDGFQMYASELSRWNAAEMGPQRDVLGELKAAAEAAGLVFCASNHRAENYWFFGPGREFDSGLSPGTHEPYGCADPSYNRREHLLWDDLRGPAPTKVHLDDWLARACELVDKYQPKVVWFDWWIQHLAFKPYLKKFAAYYYNRALEWGVEVAINQKYDAFLYSSAVYDIERGQLSGIRPRLWQCDTAIAKNSWGYTTGNEFKDPVELVCDLIDVVSKNGCFLLNVGPKADGSITDEETEVLLGIGDWLKVNGEAIYDTTFWNTHGEGETPVPEGDFSDGKRSAYNSTDLRFTFKAPYLYVHVLKWPVAGEVVVTSLGAKSQHFRGSIEAVELVGFPYPATFTRTDQGLQVRVAGALETRYPVCLRITLE
ncbi:MAG: alpha-L-fucosidase [Spirochaetales bacterium]